jgi:hypothetical protein
MTQKNNWFSITKSEKASNGSSANISLYGKRTGTPTIRAALQERGTLSDATGDLSNIGDLKEKNWNKLIRAKYGSLSQDSNVIKDLQKNSDTTLAASLVGESGNAAGFFEDLNYLGITRFSSSDTEANTASLISSIFRHPADSAMNGLKSFKALGSTILNKAAESFSGVAEGFSDVSGAAMEMLKGGFTLNGSFTKLGKSLSGQIVRRGLNILKAVDSATEWTAGSNADIRNIRARTLCLPPCMTDVVDPGGRCYQNNILATQHVATIIPGVLDYDGIAFANKFGLTNASLASELQAFENGTENSLIFDNSSSLIQMLDLFSKKNVRMGNFRPTLLKFLMIYNTIRGRLLARLSPFSVFAINLSESELKTTGWGGVQIALNQNTTLTESGSNNFGATPLDGLLGTVKDTARMWSGIKTAVLGSEYTTGGASSALTGVLQGEDVNMPKVWQGSDFSRSYTLSFRLESPYGDPESIMEHVYKPFAFLLACSLPIYRSMFSMSMPFCVRVDCPGWFSVDCGYVSSIDFRRAPDENSWSATGLCTAIEVTMSITDIFPSMGLSVGPATLGRNYSFMGFLDNMCGMDYKEVYTAGSFSTSVKARLLQMRMIPDMAKATARAKASEFVWKAPGKIFGGNR